MLPIGFSGKQGAVQNYTEDNFGEERFGLPSTLRVHNLGDVQVRYSMLGRGISPQPRGLSKCLAMS